MNEDRTVHAVTARGREVVRYDRAGKWSFEGAGLPTVPISLGIAVVIATSPGSTTYFKRPGGRRFDAAVRKALARKEQAA